MLSDLLRLSGHHIHLAPDRPSGLRLFTRPRPQIVLCDIGLPGLDGYAVVTEMRARRHDPRPTVIALTRYSDTRASERSRATGFDYHLVKPIDPSALLQLIGAVQLAEGGTAAPHHGPITAHGSLIDTRIIQALEKPEDGP